MEIFWILDVGMEDCSFGCNMVNPCVTISKCMQWIYPEVNMLTDMNNLFNLI